MPVDGRQSETALAIARGTSRLLLSLGFSCVAELPLASGRRADLVALDAGGEIWIVEIKSSVADFRADQKWQDYRAALRPAVLCHLAWRCRCEIFPPDTGLIVADAFGAQMMCEAPEHRLAARDAQVDDARLCPRRGAAPAVARRSQRALRGHGVIGRPAGDRRRAPRQALQGDGRGRRHFLCAARRLDHRAARRQRRRQNHHHRHDHGAGGAHLRAPSPCSAPICRASATACCSG